MEFKLNNMCDWERKKAVFLMGIAEELGINTNSYGEVAVNSNSGYTYIWSEDYNFSLYMPINCKLKKSEVIALWSCSECGQEEETNLKESDDLSDIEERINDIEKEHYKDAHPEKLEE
jgi:hypothetical protein